MNSIRRTGIENLSIGYLIIAFAVSLLVAWAAEDWWLFVPVMLLLAGGFYAALGLMLKPREFDLKPGYRNAVYYMFWGGTLGIVGAIWLLDYEFPGNFFILSVMFILWVGIAITALALLRLRQSAQVPK